MNRFVYSLMDPHAIGLCGDLLLDRHRWTLPV